MSLQEIEGMLEFTLQCNDNGYQKVHVDISAMLQLLALAKSVLENENGH